MYMFKNALTWLFVSAAVFVAPPSNADVKEARTALSRLAENVKEATLSNGIKVTLYRRGTAPVFAGVVAVRVGGTDEPKGKSGIAHMLEHMAFKGTPTLGTSDYEAEKRLLAEQEEIVAASQDRAPTDEEKRRLTEIQKELEKLWEREHLTREYETRGAVGLNATTDKEMTKYFVSLPRSAFEFWCWLESERILNPVFRQFYQERDVVLEERRMRYEDDPQGKLYENLLSKAYTEHPYRHPVIGYQRDIEGLTARMIDEFHRRYYVGGNIALSVVGDVDTNADLEVLERYFGRIPAGSSIARPEVVEPKQSEERTLTLQLDSSPQIMLAYHKPAFPHPDDAPISVLEEILGGSSVAPLQDTLIKKKRVAVGVEVDEGPGMAFPNLVFFGLVPRAPHTNQELLTAFDNEIERFKREGPTVEQLEMAKRALAVQSMKEMRGNLPLALNLATSQMIFGDWRAFLTWLDQVLQVESEQVKKAANTYLKRENRTVGYLEQKGK